MPSLPFIKCFSSATAVIIQEYIGGLFNEYDFL